MEDPDIPICNFEDSCGIKLTKKGSPCKHLIEILGPTTWGLGRPNVQLRPHNWQKRSVKTYTTIWSPKIN